MTNVHNRQTFTVHHLDVIRPAIALVEVDEPDRRQVIHGAGVEMPDRGVGVVAGRHRIPSMLIIVVVAWLKLGIELVPVVRCNMPAIVANLTLGALAAAVVLTVTIVILAIVLVTTGLATGRLAAVGSGVALATVRAAVTAAARARLIGVGMARSTSWELGSARTAGVGVEAGTRDSIHRGGSFY
jgi:hypothetical protein